MTDGTWRIVAPDEAVRCPARINGRVCDRAQDLAAPRTYVRVRLQPVAAAAIPSSLLRVCRACGAKLEVNVCSVTESVPAT